jgi:hypothetical protein
MTPSLRRQSAGDKASSLEKSAYEMLKAEAVPFPSLSDQAAAMLKFSSIARR